MKYIVYIDRLFLLQAVQTLALLLLTGTFLDRRGQSVFASFLRLVLGSGAEALFFCAVFCLPGTSGLAKRLLFAAGSLAGLILIFRIRTPGLFFRAVLLYCTAGFSLAGLLYAFPKTFRGSAAASGFLLILSASAAFFWKRERKKREETIVTVELIEGNVRVVTEALIDSGNTLYDPISGKPVSVVERGVLEGRIELGRPERFRLVPFYTLGSRGLMQTVEIGKLKVKRDGQDLLLTHVLLGLYDGEVAHGGSYRMILHPALLKSPALVQSSALLQSGNGCRRRRSRMHGRLLDAVHERCRGRRQNGRKHDIKSGDARENTI
ncbi:MAG TPA: sigma-E processing peptidase SpoIIGA [Candidatus Eisenbergiella merdipullorum]|uniref:Sigma-E processing peptidase SpoIIGA n=1 Tax=Candidatus Eisenbergiella merdipullorum TaxID=2838553 RepID=A0A9D2L151_9FIRM|nr:sigma-E processing peptidase SpoIIGA [Candidatus Eisenbergiella merdipullorum]